MDHMDVEAVRVSEWTKATLDGARCPECLSANRPRLGRPYIDFSERGVVCCSVCGHSWIVPPSQCPIG